MKFIEEEKKVKKNTLCLAQLDVNKNIEVSNILLQKVANQIYIRFGGGKSLTLPNCHPTPNIISNGAAD